MAWQGVLLPCLMGHDMGIPASAQISVPADLSLPLQRLLLLFEPSFGNYHRGPATVFTMLNAVLGFVDQHPRGTCSLPAALVLLSGWTHTQECTALPPSSGVMLFLLPSWTGPQGGDVLSLGLACSWEWTPRGHFTSYPTSNTSTMQDSALSSKGATWRRTRDNRCELH